MTRDELIEATAKAIHDTDGIADTTWPDSAGDTGYRGNGGYVRLCRDPEVFRAAAHNALAAIEAAGFVVVPKEATAAVLQAMIIAGKARKANEYDVYAAAIDAGRVK